MASTVIGVCSDCVKGYRLPGEATGEMTQVDNVPAYFRSAPSLTQGQDTAEKKAIVLVSDIFGLQLDNIKIIADELSKRVGVDAFAPDYFLGKPPFKFEDVGPYLLPKRPGQIHTWGETFSFIWALLRNFTGALSIPTIFRPAVVNARLEDFLKGLRAQGYTRIGVLGYCYGGIITFHIATTDLANSVVIAHPGPVATNDAKRFKVPSSFVMAEEDKFFPRAKRNEVEAILRAKEPALPYEFVDYPGTVHGFGIRADTSLPDQKDTFEKSLDQISSWFAKTL